MHKVHHNVDGDDKRKNDDENVDNCNEHTSTDAKGKQNCTARIISKLDDEGDEMTIQLMKKINSRYDMKTGNNQDITRFI